MSQKKIINSIQLLRGFAALVVVVHHVGGYVRVNIAETLFGDKFRIGFAGVDLFFVISGFIIYFTAQQYLGQASQFGVYWSKRLIRVFPIYWLVATALFLLQWFLSTYLKVTSFSTEYGGGFWTYLQTYLLFPLHFAINPVTWTLSYELFFYLLFSLLILSKRYWIIPAIILLVSFHNLIYHPILETNKGLSYYNFVFSGYNFEFLMGFLICYYFKKITISLPFSFLLLGVSITTILYWGYGVGDYDYYKRVLVFGVPSAGILWSLLNIEEKLSFRVPRPLLLLGDASYVLYLIHFPMLLLLNKLPKMLGIVLNKPQIVAYNYGVIVVIIASAIVIHKWVEKPVTSLLTKRIR
jgi:peptidoglycan/LPS O-acetylase OafA/YrhL